MSTLSEVVLSDVNDKYLGWHYRHMAVVCSNSTARPKALRTAGGRLGLRYITINKGGADGVSSLPEFLIIIILIRLSTPDFLE